MNLNQAAFRPQRQSRALQPNQYKIWARLQPQSQSVTENAYERLRLRAVQQIADMQDLCSTHIATNSNKKTTSGPLNDGYAACNLKCLIPSASFSDT
jgi:hypothetical protein